MSEQDKDRKITCPICGDHWYLDYAPINERTFCLDCGATLVVTVTETKLTIDAFPV